jgi:hypothetical protein
MKMYRYVLLTAAVLLLLPLSAHAQFRGDVFFAQPSVSVPAGGIAVLEIQLFSGADVVGATHIEIIFDSTQAEVIGVEPGTASELVDGLASDLSPGKAGIVTLNGKSLLQPFGTVSLAKVRVKPLVAAGNRVSLSIQVKSLLRQNNTPFPSFHGFSGEVLVVSGATSPTLNSTLDTQSLRPEEDATQRAQAFRRPGMPVVLLDFETRGGEISAKARQVVVADPNAPKEQLRP